ncbi:hypothetical protein P3X46_015988 [Hevea brasiliensis]|uniref:ZF-HD dimerization-type domain-containing protein n=1 Tax=Hevea brasiliensis TaxID=3981 RepID=A0ABQ9M0Y4_HEVBR|nr:zinc-finger homeodomain protein 6 [Hevea brasiliensis]XP_021680648.2 zinc-finger homeodomain protein 6 [Hevea brasiliensis]KAJ9172780.1 hypothetical protein P3X46_015988 [Hevea brasiliensis]
MELRGQEKEMPSSLDYNTPNRDSSCKIPSASIISAFGATKSDHRHQTVTPQTLEHHLPLNLQHQTLKPARDPDQTPDPTPAPLSLPIAATRATSLTASRSISRSPPPPPASTAIATASTTSVRYRECLRNHAANMGGIVVDGCGEFMPSGEEGTPEALKCAACECHRNFHRKEIGGEKPQCAANCYYTNNNQRNTLPLPQQLATSLPQPQASVHQYHGYPHGFSMTPSTAPIAPMMMTFGGRGSGGTESSSEDINMFQSNLQGARSMQPSSLKKRLRTKFSQEQKDKMMEFAERLGWKIQKQDEQDVQQFCSRVGLKRKVFKVWMHNNKQSMKKANVSTIETLEKHIL